MRPQPPHRHPSVLWSQCMSTARTLDFANHPPWRVITRPRWWHHRLLQQHVPLQQLLPCHWPMPRLCLLQLQQVSLLPPVTTTTTMTRFCMHPNDADPPTCRATSVSNINAIHPSLCHPHLLENDRDIEKAMALREKNLAGSSFRNSDYYLTSCSCDIMWRYKEQRFTWRASVDSFLKQKDD